MKKTTRMIITVAALLVTVVTFVSSQLEVISTIEHNQATTELVIRN